MMRVTRRFGRGPRRLRVGKKLLIAVLAVVMIHSAAVLVMRLRVESELMALKKQGYPITASDIVYPPVPAADTAAPIYSDIFVRVSDSDATRVESMIEGLLNPLKSPYSSTDWNTMKQAIAPYRDIPILVRRAEDSPAGYVSDHPSTSYMGQGPNADYLEKTSWLLIGEAMLAARDHQSAQAFHLITLDLRLEKCIRDDSDVEADRARFEIANEACTAIQTIAQPGNISSPEERTMEDEIGRIDLSSTIRPRMIADRANTIDNIQGIGANGAARLLRTLRLGEEQEFCLKCEGSYIWSPIFYADELAYLHAEGREIDHVTEPWRVRMERHIDSRVHLPLYDVLTWLWGPDPEIQPRNRDLAIAGLAGSRIFLALLRYKARSGSYPTSLNELSPLLGGSVPIDPFSGKGFEYQRLGGGFTLRSVGPSLNGDNPEPAWVTQTSNLDVIAWSGS